MTALNKVYRRHKMSEKMKFKVGDIVYFKNSYTNIPIRCKVVKKLTHLRSYLISPQQLLPKEEFEIYSTKEEAENEEGQLC